MPTEHSETATELGPHDFYKSSDFEAGDTVDGRATPQQPENDRGLLVPRLARRRGTVRAAKRLRKCALCCACVVGFPACGTLLCMTAYMEGSKNPLLLGVMGTVLPT